MVESDRVPSRDRARAIALLLALAVGEILAVSALAVGIRLRVPLAVLAGTWFHLGLFSAAVATVLGLAAVLACVRKGRRGEPSASWRALRALFATAVLGGAVFLVTVPQFETPWIRLFAAGCFGLWAGFLLVEERILHGAPRFLHVADLILFDLALVLFLTEGSLRLVSRVHPTALLATSDSGAEQLIAHLRQPAGVLRGGFPTNSGGHYDEEFGPKRPGETLVACIGDSHSYSAVPHYWHYTTICERLLPDTRVDNFGVPGVGPPEYEIMLRTEALPLHPDLAVIAVFVGNDVSFLGAGDVRGGGIVRSWLDRTQNRTWNLIHRIARIRADARAGGGHDLGTPDASGAIPGRVDDPEELVRLCPWLRDPALEPPGMSEPVYLSIEKQRASDVCTTGADFYAPFFEAMQTILKTAGKTRLGVLLLPDQFQVDDALWNRILADAPHARPERDRPQRLIGAWLQARGVPFVDMLPRMRETPLSPDGSRHLYVLQNTHFNVRGNEVAAACLADLVRTMLAER